MPPDKALEIQMDSRNKRSERILSFQINNLIDVSGSLKNVPINKVQVMNLTIQINYSNHKMS